MAIREKLTDPARVSELGTILGIWAHPDDEAYLSGGLMALAARGGQRVVCVTATRGELGTSDPETWPPEKLAEERTRELEACLSVLGVAEHRWFDYPDGGCPGVPEDEAVSRIASLLAEVKPDTVLTFGPDGMTGHADHVAVSRWTTLAFDDAAPSGARLHYATAVPAWLDRWMPIAEKLNIVMDGSLLATTPVEELSIDLRPPEEVIDLKFEALRSQKSQTQVLIDAVGEPVFRTFVADEWFRLAATA